MTQKKDTKRRVLLVVRHPVGGIRTFIKYVYKKLYFDNYIFTIIIPKSGATELFMSTNKEIDCEYITCDDNNFSLFKTILSTLRKDRFALIHSHGFTSGICAAIPSKLTSVPHLMTSHDVIMEKQFQGYMGRIKKRYISLMFENIDVIQFVSNDAKDNFQESLPRINKPSMLTIVNGIDVSQYTAAKIRNLHLEFKFTKRHFIIGFFGRFMSQKGFKYLIEAIEALVKDSELSKVPIVFAVGYGGFIREEQLLISKKGLDDHFIFMPETDNIAPILNGVDVVVMPSLWEACPLLPMEALVSGVPLIATDCIGLREVIKDTPSFVTKAGDSKSLAAVIRECMSNNRHDDFITYRPKAIERFNSSNTSSELTKLYNKMTG